MAKGVCPGWVGYFLISPLRKILENADKILSPVVRAGMTVLEPGCGMGFFTLPLARRVGPAGRVVAVDIQPKMLAVLRKRARRAGLLQRIDIRKAEPDCLGIEDLSGTVDLTAAIHMVHEMPDPNNFFSEIWTALKPGGTLLFIEPKIHVDKRQFMESVAMAEQIGFKRVSEWSKMSARKCLLQKED